MNDEGRRMLNAQFSMLNSHLRKEKIESKVVLINLNKTRGRKAKEKQLSLIFPHHQFRTVVLHSIHRKRSGRFITAGYPHKSSKFNNIFF